MAKQKSRFPSYGLVRGPSHEHGGVAGMVADEQPVELEGGEWIIPKEAVPDYLPVLKQITNEARAIQRAENGNTAMDALIASASMETGLSQPKSPMYQTGGRVYDPVSQSLVDQSYYTPEFRYSALKSGSDMMTMPRREEYGKLDDITAGMFDAIEAEEGRRSAYKEKHNIAAIGRSGKPIFYGPQGGIGENLLPPEERVLLLVPSDGGESGVLGKIGSFLKGINPWDKGSFTAVDDRQQGGPVYQDGGVVKDALSVFGEKSEGGDEMKRLMAMAAMQQMHGDTAMIAGQDDPYGVREGGEYMVVPETPADRYAQHIQEMEAYKAGSRERAAALRAKDPNAPWWNKQQGGPIEQYGHGGQALPRKQQEIRNPLQYGRALSRYGQVPDTTGVDFKQVLEKTLINPEVYGPPVPTSIDSVLKQIMMRDVNQSVNPFTGDTINTVLDSIRLKQQMDKSKMSRIGRKKMRQGGPVMYANGGQVGAGQPLERMGPENMGEVTGMPQLGSISRPEFEAIMEYGGPPQASDSLMAAAGQDKRVKPVDIYSILGGEGQTKAKLEIPKLSTAYLPSFGMETPLSKRQQAALFRKGIAPQTLNPQVKGLINRALVQRLTNEDD